MEKPRVIRMDKVTTSILLSNGSVYWRVLVISQ